MMVAIFHIFMSLRELRERGLNTIRARFLETKSTIKRNQGSLIDCNNTGMKKKLFSLKRYCGAVPVGKLDSNSFIRSGERLTLEKSC